MSEAWIPPALILIAGALAVPLVPGRLLKAWLVLVPIVAFLRVLSIGMGIPAAGDSATGATLLGRVPFLGHDLVFGRVDKLSNIFGHVMAIAAVIGSLYALGVRDRAQHVASWLYAGGSLGAIYAGDFLTLFIFWELMAFSSVFLIWLRREPGSNAAGMRYLLVHAAGGVALLAGIVLHCEGSGGGWAFDAFDVHCMDAGSWLILGGFVLNAAVPPLHAWLPDAYGAGTFNGSVFLCAFTTKTAVYALCRGFGGLDILVPLGVAMALYGVVYAVLENDSRRLLAYHIVSQVGYMVAAVGIGTPLAINGACALAFTNVVYKGLLFMGCGSVLHMTGESRFSALGGLYKRMPWTFLLTLVGGLSISAFPLTSGFVSKPLIVAAGFKSHLPAVGFLLMLASVGTFLHTGLKVPYFIFFGKNHCSPEVWERAADPPWNMRAAMTVSAFLCFFGGCYTPYLYGMLPNPVEFNPYTPYHLTETVQILFFTAAGFFLLIRKLEPEPTVSLDTDWFWRMGGRAFRWFARKPVQSLDATFGELYRTAGLAGLMRSAGGVRSFDNRVIDGLVDGLASAVAGIGRRLRGLQRGALQESLALAFAAAAIVAAGVLFFLGAFSR
ncbi:MAG: Na(+)/H(+) antiporter subunit D [Planctomycetota bacterium]